MPIYAYKCDSCGHAKDVLQRMSDPLLTDCPSCGASTFKKQLTAAGFQLKGSGWYVTDFKGGAAAAGVSAADKSEGASDTANASKADTGGNPGTDTGAKNSANNGATPSKADTKIETKPAPGAQAKVVAKPDTAHPPKTSTTVTPASSN